MILAPLAIIGVSAYIGHIAVDLFADPYYQVRFIDNLTKPGERLPIVLKDQPFECHIPLDVAQDLDTKLNIKTVRNTAAAIVQNTTGCVYLVEPYWTYKLCHNESLIQFQHSRKNHLKIEKQADHIYKLGKYNGGEYVVEHINGLMHIKVPFTDGTLCGISGKPRKTDIYYYCDPHSSHVQLVSINEPSICSYEVMVNLPELCLFEEFWPTFIDCAPVDGELNPNLKVGDKTTEVDDLKSAFSEYVGDDVFSLPRDKDNNKDKNKDKEPEHDEL